MFTENITYIFPLLRYFRSKIKAYHENQNNICIIPDFLDKCTRKSKCFFSNQENVHLNVSVFSNVCRAEAFVSVNAQSFDNINTSAKNRKLSDICFSNICLKIISIKEEIHFLLNYNIIDKGTTVLKSRFNQHYVCLEFLLQRRHLLNRKMACHQWD